MKPTFAAIETLEAAFRECSKGKPFFGGDSVGYLDVMLGGLVAWVHASKARHGLELWCLPEPTPKRVGGALQCAG